MTMLERFRGRQTPDEGTPEEVRPAILWEPEEEQRVRCILCSHRCLISEGQRGICRVRENRGGTLYTLVYLSLIHI